MEKLQFISQQNAQFTHLESIKGACEAGVKWIQLRIKDADYSEILDSARAAKEICDKHDAKLIINDHPDIAAEIRAYGVHVGKDDMPIAEARKIVGKNMIIGGTANTLEDVIHHYNAGADYVGLGPFRFTATKKKLSPVLGQEGYLRVMQELKNRNIKIPVFAIGGITLADVKNIRETGVYGIAVSLVIAESLDKKKTVDSLNNLIHGSLITSQC
jgi:thiamine-phosphate pyrophosphorylase